MIAKATLIKSTTEDGFVTTRREIGTEFLVETDSVRQSTLYNKEHMKYYMISTIHVVREDGRIISWFPLELLEIEEGMDNGE